MWKVCTRHGLNDVFRWNPADSVAANQRWVLKRCCKRKNHPLTQDNRARTSGRAILDFVSCPLDASLFFAIEYRCFGCVDFRANSSHQTLFTLESSPEGLWARRRLMRSDYAVASGSTRFLRAYLKEWPADRFTSSQGAGQAAN